MWLPNVQSKNFYSPILGEHLKIRVTTRALRCIDKAGGLDNYLLYTRDKHIASELGLQLKALLRQRYRELTGQRFVRFTRDANERALREALATSAAAAAPTTTIAAATTEAAEAIASAEQPLDSTTSSSN